MTNSRSAVPGAGRLESLCCSFCIKDKDAVAKLNATGQPGPDLEPVAGYCARVARRVDEAAELVRRRMP